MRQSGTDREAYLRDPLTGAYSRATLRSRLGEEVERAKRYGENLSLLLMDLDRLKSINDAFGHARGDDALVGFVERVLSVLRTPDLVFRYGGDEFVALLPHTSKEEATDLAERLLEETRCRPLPGHPPVSITSSIGVASLPEDAGDPDLLFEKADIRAHDAKMMGRDRAVADDGTRDKGFSLAETLRLVERERQLDALKAFFDQLPDRRRGVLLLTGERGSGKTRFLREVGECAAIRGYVVVPMRARRALKGRAFGALGEAVAELEPSLPCTLSVTDFAATLEQLLERRGAAGAVFLVDGMAELDWETVELFRGLVAFPRISRLALAYTADPEDSRRSLPVEAPLRQAIQLLPLSSQAVQAWLREVLEWEPPPEFVDWLRARTEGQPARLRRSLLYLMRRGIMTKEKGGWSLRQGYREAPLASLAATPGAPPSNLPVLLTTFVGRIREIATVKERLTRGRLLTIVGPGGIGKSRLALQAAAEQLELFPDGVFLVPLGTVISPRFMLAAICESIGFSLAGDADPKAQLMGHLQDKKMLLVMDGAEHLLEGAGLVTDLLRGAPDLSIVVTSRERLNVEGEGTLRLKGLRVDRDARDVEGASAVQLFVQVARRIAPDFALDDRRLSDVSRICRLVEGMPLAIEIAASWLPSLGCEEILSELERGIDLLATRLRDVPERHRSIRAVFDQSWGLLSDRERNVLKRMSVFRGGFDRAAAEGVTGATPDLLSSLVDKSLLRLSSDGHYDLHDLLRQYVEDKLGRSYEASEDAHNAHATYYASLLSDSKERLLGEHQATALRQIENEIANAQAGWDWAIRQGMLREIEEYLVPLFTFYHVRGLQHHGEGVLREAAESLAERVAAQNAPDDRLHHVLARVRMRQAILTCLLGRYAAGRALLEDSITVLRNANDKADAQVALQALGDVAMRQGDYRESERLLGESLALARDMGDRWNESHALAALAGVRLRQGNYQAATELLERSLVISRKHKNQRTLLRCLNSLGNVAYYLGDFAKARNYYEEGLDVSRELGEVAATAVILGGLGNAATVVGDYEKAKELYEESLTIAKGIRSDAAIARSTYLLGVAEYYLGRHEEARRYVEESVARYRALGERRENAYALSTLGDIAFARGDYVEARQLARECAQIFREMGERRGLASSLSQLGETAVATGDLAGAAPLLRESLEIARAISDTPLALTVLGEWAKMLAARGDATAAAGLLAYVIGHESCEAGTRAKATTVLEGLPGTLSGSDVNAGAARWSGRGVDGVAEELLGSPSSGGAEPRPVH